jgi:hypothetical protein
MNPFLFWVEIAMSFWVTPFLRTPPPEPRDVEEVTRWGCPRKLPNVHRNSA